MDLQELQKIHRAAAAAKSKQEVLKSCAEILGALSEGRKKSSLPGKIIRRGALAAFDALLEYNKTAKFQAALINRCELILRHAVRDSELDAIAAQKLFDASKKLKNYPTAHGEKLLVVLEHAPRGSRLERKAYRALRRAAKYQPPVWAAGMRSSAKILMEQKGPPPPGRAKKLLGSVRSLFKKLRRRISPEAKTPPEGPV